MPSGLSLPRPLQCHARRRKNFRQRENKPDDGIAPVSSSLLWSKDCPIYDATLVRK